MTTRGEPWASFPHDPRDPSVASLRASDADREVVHRVLADAFADGRLTREEHDERTAAVLATRTLGELPPLVSDLVPDRPIGAPGGRWVPLVAASSTDLQQRAEEHWRQERRNAFFGFLGPTLICWTIWALVMFGEFPWPIIVSAITLVNFLRTAASRQEIVAREVRRLEKKQAKELQARSQPPDPESQA